MLNCPAPSRQAASAALPGLSISSHTEIDFATMPAKNSARREAMGGLAKGLAVMDTAAFALARDNGLPIIVFNIHEPGALTRIVAGEPVGTLVSA